MLARLVLWWNARATNEWMTERRAGSQEEHAKSSQAPFDIDTIHTHKQHVYRLLTCLHTLMARQQPLVWWSSRYGEPIRSPIINFSVLELARRPGQQAAGFCADEREPFAHSSLTRKDGIIAASTVSCP